MRELRRQPFLNFLQKAPQPTALKPPSTARTAGRSDWAERRFRRQPFILLSFFVLEKGSKSAGNAVIPTYPAHCPHGLQHLRRKRSTFAFTPESGYTLGSAQRIAHSGSHGETGGVLGGGGITTLGAFHTVRKPCVAGCQNGVLCRFWGLVVGAPKERREPSGQRCAYARRCSEGVAAPLGCVICLQLGDVAVFSLCAQYFLNVRGGGGITTLGAFHTFRKPCVARG